MSKEKFQEIGGQFRHRREEMGISLKEAENATSIRMAYLQAIEQGEVQKLISPIYAQGFVKQYAVYLGVDVDPFLRENPELFGRPDKQEFSYGIGTLEMRGNPGGGVKWIPNAVWILGVIGVCVLAWFFARWLEVL